MLTSRQHPSSTREEFVIKAPEQHLSAAPVLILEPCLGLPVFGNTQVPPLLETPEGDLLLYLLSVAVESLYGFFPHTCMLVFFFVCVCV